jgi:hypothetical protein
LGREAKDKERIFQIAIHHAEAAGDKRKSADYPWENEPLEGLADQIKEMAKFRAQIMGTAAATSVENRPHLKK